MYISSTTATETGTARSSAGGGARLRRGVDRDRGELHVMQNTYYSCWRKHALELSPFLSLVRMLRAMGYGLCRPLKV